MALFVCVCALCPAQTLREAAAPRSVMVGAAAAYDFLSEIDYAGVLGREYDLLEPENDLKWPTVHPAKDVYAFRNGDGLAAYARQHRMYVRGHTLVWHNAIPDWLSSGNYSAAQLSAILQDYISTVMRHYAGSIYSWDVVNEALNDDGTLRDSLWFNRPGIGSANRGTAYIEQAFRWAHDADPNALLFYNDFGAETVNSKSDAIFAMARDFQSRGVPIDGVGLQMHLNLAGVALAGLDANLARLTGLGLLVHITELDVRVPVDANGAASPADLEAQARVYHDVAAVCFRYPLCEAIQTWGFSDRHSWIPSAFPGFGAALPFDAQYQPKRAYAALQDAFATTAPPLSAAGIVNAADFQGGAVSPGEIVTIFGATYGPVQLAKLALDGDGRVSTNLADTRVLFDGVPAPVIYAESGQTSVVVPYSVDGKLETRVEYEYRGLKSSPVALPVTSSTPAIFSADATGTGPGAILNQDSTLNQDTNPAAPGSVIQIYAMGGGATDPRGIDGQVAGASLPKPVSRVAVTIGGLDAEVLYAGAAPGFVAGVLQVNARVPAAAPPGAVPVAILIGRNVSPSGITVAVR